MPALSDGIDSFDAPMVYEDPVRGMVKKLKFDDKPELVQPLVSLMRSNVANVENPLVLPVPMHRSRLWKRQFNQSSLLAVRLAKVLQLDVDVFSFKRIKKTEQQVGKSASARKKNLSGAFQVDAAKVDGRNIILVDDVWTTGSTASACAKCLKKAGAKSVHVVTIAYVPK